MFYKKVEGWALTDAIYFAFVSLIPTSVDIGLSPQTDFGKWFTIIYLVVGVGVMLMLLVMIGKSIVNFSEKEEPSAPKKNDVWAHTSFFFSFDIDSNLGNDSF